MSAANPTSEAADPRLQDVSPDEVAAEAVSQFLTFVVADEAYGLPINYIAEIIGAQRFTSVPDPRPFMKGVINLRGTVIPVMDVRVRLAMEPRDITERSCIVVVDFEDTVVGLLVDTISDVVEVLPAAIEPAPKRSTESACGSIVTGLVQIEDEVKILVDLRRLLFDVEDLTGGNNDEH
ncbi:MAG: chemotaxis protein CheW [bacterium]|nr:chemotaxis protein CheW [bacterium]